MQAQSTIDNAQRNHNSAIPEMKVRPDLSPAQLLELPVVDEAQDWLEEQSSQHDKADDRVVVYSSYIQLRVPHSVSKCWRA